MAIVVDFFNYIEEGRDLLKSLTKKITQLILKQFRVENPIKSVGMKLFFIFFLCIVILVSVTGFFSYSKSKGIIKDKMAGATKQTIQQAGDKMDLVFRNYESMTFDILTDSEMIGNLSAYYSKSKEVDKFTSYSKVLDKLTKKIHGKNGLTNIHILPADPQLKPITTAFTFEEPEKYVKEPWFNKIVKANGVAVWLDTKIRGYTDSDKSTFAVGLLLKSDSGAEFVLLMEIDTSVLISGIDQIKISDSAEMVILNEQNTLMISTKKQKAEEIFHVPTIVDKAKIEALDANGNKISSSESKTQDVDEKSQLVVYKHMASSGWIVEAVAPVSELVQETKQIFNATLIIALIAMLVACAAGFFVARMIGRPLIILRNLMKEGEQGNLTVRTQHNSKDEIGQLSFSFNQMMEQITRLVQQTNQSARDVLATAGELLNSSNLTATSAREIAIATEEIANGASSLATEAERGNGLTHEISLQMKHVVEANANMGVSANEVQNASRQGTFYMAELTTKTTLTEDMTRTIFENVGRLKESTSSIRKILDVLNDMTKQTNILSLNAAIEAARAGTAGKGFMVVADEIRKLAEQSKQSIGIVGKITDTIQMEIGETVAALSESYPVFQEQIKSVKEAELIFKQVQTHMSGFVEQLSAVTDSILLLDESQNVLTEAMTNVSAVSEEASATSEEVASLSNEQLSISQGIVKLSEKLAGLSHSLQDSLSKFRV